MRRFMNFARDAPCAGRWKRGTPLLVSLALCSLLSTRIPASALVESERMAEYHARNYTWPLQHFVPDTPGWRHLLNRRFEQLERVETSHDRYNGWIAVMTSAVSNPNFTETGWGLTKAPAGLVSELKAKLHEGLPTAKPERDLEVITNDEHNRPLFVNVGSLRRRVLDELKPMHEEWAGVPLKPAMAYGLRVYRNNSNLNMHTDKAGTHIVSCILHVDHSDDSDPWPIVIEDYLGNTNEVILESGDMLFYESSKCLHGRPKNFTGSWYSSIFVHFYPQNWDIAKASLESHYAVPEHWNKQKRPDKNVDRLDVVGTSFQEPDCEDSWCGLEHSVKWFGPAKEGVVITTGYDLSDNDAIEARDELADGDEL